MQKIIIKYLLTSAMFVSYGSLAQAETLDSAIRYAVQNHPSIQATKAAEGVAQKTIEEEKSALYPVANLGASFGRVYSNTTTTRGLSVSRGAGYSWYGEGNGRLNQTLYDFDATKNSIQAAHSRYMAADSTTNVQEVTIELQAMQSYLQLLRATTLLSKAIENKVEMEDFFDRIQIAYDNGGADESEVSRAQDLVSTSKNIILQYDSELQISKASFREVVGRLPDGEVVEPSLDLRLLPDTIDDAIAMSLSLNPQLKVAGYNTKANKYELEREQTNLMPTFDAELSAFKKDQDDLIGGESEDVRGLVRANWDYSFGGADRAVKDRAAFALKEAEFNKEALKRTIERDVEVAWISLNLATQQKKNEMDRFEATKQTLETFREQYEGGQQKILDVMGAMNAAFFAEQDYLNIKYQEMSATYTLMNVIGLPLVPEGQNDVASAQ